MQAPPSLHRTNNPLRASGLFFVEPPVLKKTGTRLWRGRAADGLFPGAGSDFSFFRLEVFCLAAGWNFFSGVKATLVSLTTGLGGEKTDCRFFRGTVF